MKSENDIRENISYLPQATSKCVDARRENGVSGLSLRWGIATRVWKFCHAENLNFCSSAVKLPKPCDDAQVALVPDAICQKNCAAGASCGKFGTMFGPSLSA
jgi:hypothetical protein